MSASSTFPFLLRQLLSARMRYRLCALTAVALIILAKLTAIAVPLMLKAIVQPAPFAMALRPAAGSGQGAGDNSSRSPRDADWKDAGRPAG